jgi:hypothetical protein
MKSTSFVEFSKEVEELAIKLNGNKSVCTDTMYGLYEDYLGNVKTIDECVHDIVADTEWNDCN